MSLRTPYLKTDDSALARGRYFAERGYALVLQDVRGRGDSDGAFVPYRNEGRDGHDTIEWVAAQPWCDGNVGTMGGSYLGRIQWLAALERPPHLRAMFIAVCPSDPFVEWPTEQRPAAPVLAAHDQRAHHAEHQRGDRSAAYEHLPLLTMDEHTGRSMPQWREELGHERLDDYWRAICYQTSSARSTCRSCTSRRRHDDEQIGNAAAELPRHGRAGPHAACARRPAAADRAVGPPDRRRDQPGRPRLPAGGAARPGSTRSCWFDHWLKGVPNGVAEEPPVRIFVMGANEARRARVADRAGAHHAHVPTRRRPGQ